jgi:hypothetical protein
MLDYVRQTDDVLKWRRKKPKLHDDASAPS